MIPTPSETLVKELGRMGALHMFPYNKKHHCARINMIHPAEIIVSIWDISELDGILKDMDHESSIVPTKCSEVFPVGWKRMAHFKSTKTAEDWSDWVVVQGNPSSTESYMSAFLDAYSSA